ncbi:MAG: phosphatase PAP2 family protein [Chlamydiales bacterium]|nr:phosphatase PAP2 family protein [Chlamydiales bacterium]
MVELSLESRFSLKENICVKVLEKFGDVGQYAIPAVIAGHALLTGSATEAIAMGVLGYVQKLEVFSIKHHFPRNRPEPYVFGKVSREDTESFPSSHTGGAFLGAGLACGLYGLTSPITVTTIALASLVGVSRCLSKKHWPTDVIGGAAIGSIHGLVAAGCRQLFFF